MSPRPGPRPQLRAWDFGKSPELQRPLNDALSAVAERIDAVEMVGVRIVALPPFEILTGGTVPVGTAPFPVSVALPEVSGRSLVGVLVLRVDNLTAAGVAGMGLAAHGAQWRVESAALAVQHISGLAATTRYRVTLGGVYA